MKKTQTGVTLVELMIAIAIVGILSAIAYPSYQDHVQRTNRTTATACLLELAQFMERSYTAAFSYQGIALGGEQCINDLNNRYNFALDNLGDRTFTLTATPIGPQVGDACGALTYNQAGRKGANGGFVIADVQRCW